MKQISELEDARRAAEQGAGYAAKAAEWRVKLEKWQSTARSARFSFDAPRGALIMPHVKSDHLQRGRCGEYTTCEELSRDRVVSPR